LNAETGAPATLMRGIIVAAFGRQYLVKSDTDEMLLCVPRGKKSEVACGDRVAFARTSANQGVIERIEPRSTLYLRSAAYRQKLIAANATQVAIVVAAEPSFSEELICRLIVGAEHQGMKSLLVLNKADLPGTPGARDRLAPFAAAGHRLVEISAIQDCSALLPFLNGETTVLVGQSGMGKSTLINGLVPDAEASTREISAFLDSGRHTTTHARIYRLDAASMLIDCPGLQEFGLHHMSRAEMEYGFVEFRPFLGKCRFNDCRHDVEPGCALIAARDAGLVTARRFELLRRILAAERA
jgi:ribosome biogenesis GTPase